MPNPLAQHSRKLRGLSGAAKLVLLVALSLALSVGVNGALLSSGFLRPIPFIDSDSISPTLAHHCISFGESR